MVLFAIIIAALAETLVSFAGGFIVIVSPVFAREIAHRILGFAIGALLGVSFFEIIPEAVEKIGLSHAFGGVAGGIVIFFIAEKLLRWYHHHEGHEGEPRPYALLIQAGDAIHNFIDGIVLAVSFLVSLPLGIATTLAVLVHEIPQEMADFAVLIRGGFSIRRALWLNFLVSLTTLAGAAIGYVFGSRAEQWLPYVLGVIAGNFLYIALSDLIPETHEESGLGHLATQLALMLIGISLMYAMS
ncbi:MAG: ZIP family metal transporter [Candidatus Sungbacteria bacterium]|uniref:ZIP family metal transporter n=1 Tax=Candidatus Sungiibacteriota bacterium TaxID=2750080 RepID=A0A932YYC4_9BACT|nr:ZIP family metal transporter [Candidatus Sungbacteria bacterium]